MSTRNQRLAAIRSFFRSVSNSAPEAVERCQGILSIPNKRGDTTPVDYLTVEEVTDLLSQVDTATASGRRDHALLSFLYNTGARVQEACDVRVRDLRLDAPAHVRLQGKGRKERLCPLWPETAELVRSLVDEQTEEPRADTPIFLNRQGKPLTRFGVRYILGKYVKRAAATSPTLDAKRVHPYTLRHTTAMHLLQADVDLNTIRCWLGHASITTTNRYVEIDLEMKRRALGGVSPPEGGGDGGGAVVDEKLLAWLEAL